MVSVSSDGQNWRDVDDNEFRTMLATLSVDCWVDLSEPGKMLHVTLGTLRAVSLNDPYMPARIRENGADPMPTELYGIPIVYEDSK